MEFLLYSIVNSVWENMTQFHNILIGHALIQDSRWHKRPSRIQSFTWQHNSNVSNIFLFCFTWYLNTLVKNYSKCRIGIFEQGNWTTFPTSSGSTFPTIFLFFRGPHFLQFFRLRVPHFLQYFRIRVPHFLQYLIA